AAGSAGVRPAGASRRSPGCAAARARSIRGPVRGPWRTGRCAPADRLGTAGTWAWMGSVGRGRRAGPGSAAGGGRFGPDAAAQDLVRPEARFVGHFTAFVDPVAQVQPGQAQAVGVVQLPEDAVGAQAAVPVGVVEGI